jgi:hypothetical protein
MPHVDSDIDFHLLWDAPVSGATKQPPFAPSVRCCGESVAKPRIESGSRCQEIFLFSRRCQKMTKAVLHSASPPFPLCALTFRCRTLHNREHRTFPF